MTFRMARDRNNSALPCVAFGPSQNVTAGAATSNSALFTAGTAVVRVISSGPARIAFGTAPTAGPTSPLLAAGVPEYIRLPDAAASVQQRAAVIREGGTDASVNITEVR